MAKHFRSHQLKTTPILIDSSCYLTSRLYIYSTSNNHIIGYVVLQLDHYYHQALYYRHVISIMGILSLVSVCMPWMCATCMQVLQWGVHEHCTIVLMP